MSKEIAIEITIGGERAEVALVYLVTRRKRAVDEWGVDCNDKGISAGAEKENDIRHSLLVVMSMSGCSSANFQISLSATVFEAEYAQNGLRVPSNACSFVAGFQSIGNWWVRCKMRLVKREDLTFIVILVIT